MSKTYGYVRVSTREQHEDRQVDALKIFGVQKRNILMDKVSGKDFMRPNYQKLVHKKLKRGDLLVVKSIDRLGRNYDEILEEWRFITKLLQADILVLDMPLLDTRVKKDSLVGNFIADVVLQVLSFVAQNERETTMIRQREGIAAAKARGVRFGRPKRVLPDNFSSIVEQWRSREMTLEEALLRTSLPRSSFYAAAKSLTSVSNAAPGEVTDTNNSFV